MVRGGVEPPTFRFSGLRITVQARPRSSFFLLSARLCTAVAAHVLAWMRPKLRPCAALLDAAHRGRQRLLPATGFRARRWRAGKPDRRRWRLIPKRAYAATGYRSAPALGREVPRRRDRAAGLRRQRGTTIRSTGRRRTVNDGASHEPPICAAGVCSLIARQGAPTDRSVRWHRPDLHDMRVIFMEILAGLHACPSWRWRPACRAVLL